MEAPRARRPSALLRERIKSIMNDASLSEWEKPRRIQALMSSGGLGSNSRKAPAMEGTVEQSERESESDTARPSSASCEPPRHGDRSSTPHGRPSLRSQASDTAYYDLGDGAAGCKHYLRSCRVRGGCCMKWYTCRLCHDEAEDHTLDRFSTRDMQCMHCGLAQPPAQHCGNGECGKQLARYFCGRCNLWDDDASKQIYHCDKCGLCRIGRGLGVDYFHCDTCGVCMAMSLKDNHRCIENSLDSDCPICGDYMFTSTRTVIFMPCSHCMHQSCYEEHIKRSYKCPVCQRSLGPMRQFFRKLDEHLANEQMPPEYQGLRSRIACNDCHAETIAPFHFLYHKCQQCGSYNTWAKETLPADAKR